MDGIRRSLGKKVPEGLIKRPLAAQAAKGLLILARLV
jgi:hypothetical protein